MIPVIYIYWSSTASAGPGDAPLPGDCPVLSPVMLSLPVPVTAPLLSPVSSLWLSLRGSGYCPNSKRPCDHAVTVSRDHAATLLTEHALNPSKTSQLGGRRLCRRTVRNRSFTQVGRVAVSPRHDLPNLNPALQQMVVLLEVLRVQRVVPQYLPE